MTLKGQINQLRILGSIFWKKTAILCLPLTLIGSMSPWVLPERTLGTFRQYPGRHSATYVTSQSVAALRCTKPFLIQWTE